MSCARCGGWRRSSRRRAASPTCRASTTRFCVDWDAAADGRVAIVPRPRGSPLDKLVAELMIHVNSSWGKLLADADAPGLYRTQQAGKVKMSTQARAASGPRCRALPVGELAAAPLQRSRQPAAADRRCRRRPAALCRERRRAFRGARRFRGHLRAVRRIPEPDGALLVPALARAGKARRGDGDRRARQPGALRRAAARTSASPICRPPPARACGSRSARIDLLAATSRCDYAGAAP